MFFSAPFFFKDEYIDFLANLNNQDTKYKIKRVYNSLSYWSDEDYSGFEYYKSVNSSDARLNKSSFNDLKKYVGRLKDLNIEFIYAMNIATPYSTDKFNSLIPRLNSFINRLRDIGVTYISVANQMLADHINRNFPDINIGISTMMHVDSIERARLLKKLFSNIEYIIPCIDINKDFDFFKSFSKLLPNTNLELMANEGCLFCCPTKNLHYVTFGMTRENTPTCPARIKSYPNVVCSKLTNDDAFLQLVIGKTIFPWEISDYEAQGVNSIKLVGRDYEYKITTKQIETYMIGSTDPEKIMNKYLPDIVPFRNTINHSNLSHTLINYVTLSDIRKHIPSNDFFIKTKTDCRSVCQSSCNYCYSLSKDLEIVAKNL